MTASESSIGTRGRMAMIATSLSLLPLLGLPAIRLRAQPTQGTIVAFVADETDRTPLKGVQIDVIGRSLTGVTDEEGRVVFEGVPEGSSTLRAALAGYGSVSESVVVTAGQLSVLQYSLPRIDAVLSALLVQTSPRVDTRSQGHAEARVEDRARTALSAADLLARAVPSLDMNRPGGPTGAGASVRLRGTSSIHGTPSPAIYLDGIRIDTYAGSVPGSPGSQGLHTLETIPASEIRQIRVLRGPAATAQHADAADGVILIETRKGEGNVN